MLNRKSANNVLDALSCWSCVLSPSSGHKKQLLILRCLPPLQIRPLRPTFSRLDFTSRITNIKLKMFAESIIITVFALVAIGVVAVPGPEAVLQSMASRSWPPETRTGSNPGTSAQVPWPTRQLNVSLLHRQTPQTHSRWDHATLERGGGAAERRPALR